MATFEQCQREYDNRSPDDDVNDDCIHSDEECDDVGCECECDRCSALKKQSYEEDKADSMIEEAKLRRYENE